MRGENKMKNFIAGIIFMVALMGFTFADFDDVTENLNKTQYIAVQIFAGFCANKDFGAQIHNWGGDAFMTKSIKLAEKFEKKLDVLD